MASSPRQHIRWHRRMEARVVIGVILLVALSLAGVVLAAVRVTTHSSLQRAAVNLEDARSAFYRLVDDRADFAASQTRLIIALPLFRSFMINPVIAGDLATLTGIRGQLPARSRRRLLHPDESRGEADHHARLDGRHGVSSRPGGGHQRRVGRRIPPRHRADWRQVIPDHLGAGQVRGNGSAGHAHVRVCARRQRRPAAGAAHAFGGQPRLRHGAGGQQPARRREERTGHGTDQRRAAESESAGHFAGTPADRRPPVHRRRLFAVSRSLVRSRWAISCCCRIGRPRSSSSTS